MNKKEQEETAKKILDTLTGNRFERFYKGDFENFLMVTYPEGHPKRKSREEVLDQISSIFRIYTW